MNAEDRMRKRLQELRPEDLYRAEVLAFIITMAFFGAYVISCLR